jgi:hypothetical protein
MNSRRKLPIHLDGDQEMSIIFTVAPTTLLGIDQIRDLENKYNLLVYKSKLLAHYPCLALSSV